MDAVRRRTVDINEIWDEAHVIASKLILHSAAYDFDIGTRGRAFIRMNYSPEMDQAIGDYLRYRGYKHPNIVRFVASRLAEIKEGA
jgi:hypothetical protein